MVFLNHVSSMARLSKTSDFWTGYTKVNERKQLWAEAWLYWALEWIRKNGNFVQPKIESQWAREVAGTAAKEEAAVGLHPTVAQDLLVSLPTQLNLDRKILRSVSWGLWHSVKQFPAGGGKRFRSKSQFCKLKICFLSLQVIFSGTMTHKTLRFF